MNKLNYGNFDSTSADIAFSSVNGYVDPASELETRKQLSYPLKEIKDYINNTIPTDTGDNPVQLVVTSNSIGYRTTIGGTVNPIASSSHSHGNITSTGDITTNVAIASGDRLVINDESASKINNSSITFGTSTTQFLSNAGTWVTPSGGSITVTKLWTNPSPTSAFPAQTISLTLSSYFAVHVIYRWYTNQNYYYHVFIPKGVGSAGVVTSGNQFRNFSVTNSGVTVDAGTNSGESCIPYQIWGVKIS